MSLWQGVTLLSRKAARKNRRRALLTPPTAAHLSRELPFTRGIRIPAVSVMRAAKQGGLGGCHAKTHPRARVRIRTSGRDNGSSTGDATATIQYSHLRETRFVFHCLPGFGIHPRRIIITIVTKLCHVTVVLSHEIPRHSRVSR